MQVVNIDILIINLLRCVIVFIYLCWILTYANLKFTNF